MRPAITSAGLRTGVLLAGAVLAEVGGTAALRLSDGFADPPWAGAVVAAYAVALVLLARVLRHGVPLGVAYGTLVGCGLLAAAVIGAAAFGEALTGVQAAGLLVLGGGVVALQGSSALAPA